MLAYRFEVWSYLVLQILMMIAIGYFWRAVYAGVDISHDVSVQGMTTYTVISALVSSLSYMGVEDRITEAVKSGSIATDMIKPINLFSLYLAEDMGSLVISLFRYVGVLCHQSGPCIFREISLCESAVRRHHSHLVLPPLVTGGSAMASLCTYLPDTSEHLHRKV